MCVRRRGARRRSRVSSTSRSEARTSKCSGTSLRKGDAGCRSVRPSPTSTTTRSPHVLDGATLDKVDGYELSRGRPGRDPLPHAKGRSWRPRDRPVASHSTSRARPQPSGSRAWPREIINRHPSRATVDERSTRWSTGSHRLRLGRRTGTDAVVAAFDTHADLISGRGARNRRSLHVDVRGRGHRCPRARRCDLEHRTRRLVALPPDQRREDRQRSARGRRSGSAATDRAMHRRRGQAARRRGSAGGWVR